VRTDGGDTVLGGISRRCVEADQCRGDKEQGAFLHVASLMVIQGEDAPYRKKTHPD
jgi:hypothetical protein